jgi:hypothetical protein
MLDFSLKNYANVVLFAFLHIDDYAQKSLPHFSARQTTSDFYLLQIISVIVVFLDYSLFVRFLFALRHKRYTEMTIQCERDAR